MSSLTHLGNVIEVTGVRDGIEAIKKVNDYLETQKIFNPNEKLNLLSTAPMVGPQGSYSFVLSDS